jgi:hypothetical protein
MSVRLADFAQLKLIAWNRTPDDCLDDDEALALYEANWWYVDQTKILEKEQELINRLVKECGGGVLHV